MSGSQALDAFLKELAEKQEEWRPEMLGFADMVKYMESAESQGQLRAIIAEYEERFALIGDGKVIKVDELVADGYPDMNIPPVTPEVHQQIAQHLEHQHRSFTKSLPPDVQVKMLSRVRAAVQHAEEK